MSPVKTCAGGFHFLQFFSCCWDWSQLLSQHLPSSPADPKQKTITGPSLWVKSVGQPPALLSPKHRLGEDSLQAAFEARS